MGKRKEERKIKREGKHGEEKIKGKLERNKIIQRRKKICK